MAGYRWNCVVLGVALVTAITVAVSGCATTSGGSGTESQENMGKILGTLAGAAIGAAVSKNNRGAGALAGALIGLAAGYAFDSYNVSQRRSAKEVNEEYKKANAGKLPPQTLVTKYATQSDPSGVVRRGDQVSFVSDIEVIKGTAANRPDKIDEELILYDPSGQGEKRVRKPALETAKESGSYSTRFNFKPSQGTAQGTYPFKTVLYLNDIPVKESSGTIQVVSAGGAFHVVMRNLGE